MQVLKFNHLSKAYGGVPALDNVSLSLPGGRVHALMGENGAGKSTLIKLIAGVTRADAMTVLRDDIPVSLSNAQDAHNAGFRFIHQELNIVPQISVAENILLGRPLPRRFGIAVDWPALRAQARTALNELGAGHIDVTALAGDLSAGDKMMMKIAAALVADAGETAQLYVLDEPTAALTGEESEQLFRVIGRLRERGAAILYVSHRLDEVMRLCDDVTVLRDGRHVFTRPVIETRKDEIIHAMTGRDVEDSYPSRMTPIGTVPVAQVSGDSPRLSDLSFTVQAGEILGVAGLADAGQTAVLELFLGLEKLTDGTGAFDEGPLPASPSAAWDKGIAYIPRERRSQSLCLNMSIRDNMVLPHLGGYGLRAKAGREDADAQALSAKVRLKSEGTDQPVGQLSGGNQQKVVFARALHGNPKLLLLDEPTRGVDVGAKYDIYLLVRALSAQGCAVILTSSDLPEMLGMCDRVLVLQDGRQAHLRDCGSMSSADLLAHFYPVEQAG